jgi:hypothetical protein
MLAAWSSTVLLLGAAGLIMMTDWQAYDYEIDIAAELQRVASEGVAAIVAGAECLQVQLAYTSNTFMAFMTTVHWPGDGLELRAAHALNEVDELLRQQTAQEAPALPPAAVEQLKLLQRHAQDVVVLVHSRYIDQKILQCKGIPTELLLCLEATFGTGFIHDDSLWSRLGNSKYHIFTRGLRFGDRRHRRRGNGERRAAAAAADAAAVPFAVNSTASTVEDFDESLHIELLELVGTARSTEARHTGASSSSAGEPLHVHWLEWQIELALRRHGEDRNRELIDDIVKTYKALIDE